MVERKSENSDRRLKPIHITEKGKSTVEKANQIGRDYVNLVTKGISNKEIANMVGTLFKIKENISNIIGP